MAPPICRNVAMSRRTVSLEQTASRFFLQDAATSYPSSKSRFRPSQGKRRTLNSFIIGYPGETEETARHTGRWMVENDCLNSVFFATPYPGTALFEEVEDKIVARYGSTDEYIKNLADATDFKVNLTDIPDTRLIELRKKMMIGEAF